MNLCIFSQKAYENKSIWTLGENKPNSNPIKPNLKRAKMDVSVFATKDYENKWQPGVRENKPNMNPIQTQTNPVLSAVEWVERANFRKNEFKLLCCMVL